MNETVLQYFKKVIRKGNSDWPTSLAATNLVIYLHQKNLLFSKMFLFMQKDRFSISYRAEHIGKFHFFWDKELFVGTNNLEKKSDREALISFQEFLDEEAVFVWKESIKDQIC